MDKLTRRTLKIWLQAVLSKKMRKTCRRRSVKVEASRVQRVKRALRARSPKKEEHR